MQLWASHYTLTKLNRTSIAFVFVLFLCQHTAIENLLTDATQQPLEFYDSRLSGKPRLSRQWFRLLFCWGSLPVVAPLLRRLQRLAATNCLKFLTA